MPSTTSGRRLRFDAFEIDRESGELFKHGRRIKLQSQPFKILTALLEEPGQLVTRDQLQLLLWGRDTVVDFDHSIAAAINKIREALNDSAESPRYVETLARRGYRFIATVETVADMTILPAAEGTPLLPAITGPVSSALEQGRQAELIEATTPQTGSRAGFKAARFDLRWVAVTLCLGFAILGLALFTHSKTVPPHMVALTTDGALVLPSLFHTEEFSPIVTDGVRMFASSWRNGRSHLISVPVSGGASSDIPLPDEIASASIADLSPDGTRLLLRSRASRDSEQPLWIVSTLGGAARRVGNVMAHDATWSSNGESVLYAYGQDIYTVSLRDNVPQLFVTLPGRAFWMRWSPDGQLLRFTLVDPITHRRALWQLEKGAKTATPFLPNWNSADGECCGVWSADGKQFLFQSEKSGSGNLWLLHSRSDRSPEQMTDGPLEFVSPAASRSTGSYFFVGEDTQSSTSRYEVESHRFVPGQDLLRDALRVSYSRDRRWVAWTTGDGSLWRARTDGTDLLQLTPTGMKAFIAEWSPDGLSFAVMARMPGKTWQLFLLPSAGGKPRTLLEDGRNAADPSWSADGKQIVFGRTDDAMGKETVTRSLSILTIATGGVQPLPDSDGLFSPRWSPDGKYIVALALDGRGAQVYSVEDRRWSSLPVQSASDPTWSEDSKSLWVHEFAEASKRMVQVSMPTLQIRQVVPLIDPNNDRAGLTVYFAGLTPAGDLLIRTQTNTGNLYSLTPAH